MKRTIFLVVLCLAVFCQGFCRAEETPKNLLIVGVDGTGWRNVKELLDDGKLHNFQRFFDMNGVNVIPIELIGRTNTLAVWSMYFSGLTGDQSGAFGNWSIQKGWLKNSAQLAKYGKDYGTFWGTDFFIRSIPYEQIIFKHLQDKGMSIGYFVSKLYLLGPNLKASPLADAATNADEFFSCQPNFESGTYDPSPVVSRAKAFMKANKPFVVFAHFNADKYGHVYGEPSQEFRHAIMAEDAAFGELLDSVNRGDTKIVLIADHGFDKGRNGHVNATDAWMATDLPIHASYFMQEGQRAFPTARDFANTILAFYGVDYSGFIPVLRGKSLLR